MPETEIEFLWNIGPRRKPLFTIKKTKAEISWIYNKKREIGEFNTQRRYWNHEIQGITYLISLMTEEWQGGHVKEAKAI